jgi:hypothetical protein
MNSPVVLGLDVGGATIAVIVRAAATGRRPGSSTAGTQPDGGADRSLHRGARPSAGDVATMRTPAAARRIGPPARPRRPPRELLDLPGTTPLEKGLSG